MSADCKLAVRHAFVNAAGGELDALNGLTGQDWRALEACAHLAQLWTVADTEGKVHAADAFRAAARAMQVRSRPALRLVLLWGTRPDAWAALARGIEGLSMEGEANGS